MKSRPVGIAWAPDGRMFIWQKNGIVRVLEPDGTLLPTPFLDFSSKVNTYNDNGMLGLAFERASERPTSSARSTPSSSSWSSTPIPPTPRTAPT